MKLTMKLKLAARYLVRAAWSMPGAVRAAEQAEREQAERQRAHDRLTLMVLNRIYERNSIPDARDARIREVTARLGRPDDRDWYGAMMARRPSETVKT